MYQAKDQAEAARGIPEASIGADSNWAVLLAVMVQVWLHLN